jgi:purine-binding chemotaxis protein CheW
MRATNHLVVFTLDEQRYALHLSVVKRIVRAVEVAHLPQAPQVVLGVVNVQGQVMPVMDIRGRFGLPGREIELDDRFIVAHTGRRPIIVVADAVAGVIAYEEQDVMYAETICSGMEYIEGVVKLSDDMVFIHDLETFLSPAEEHALSALLPDC